MEPERGEPRELGKSILRWLLVLWAFAFVFYFQCKEGLINSPLLQKPAAEAVRPAPSGKFDLRLAPSEHAGVYTTVLGNAMKGRYHFWSNNVPWKDLGWICGVMLLYAVIGFVFVDCFEHYIPIGGHICLGFVFGMGLAGVAFELLTLAHLLNRVMVIGVWVAGFVAVVYAREAIHKPPYVDTPEGEDWIPRNKRKAAAADWFRKVVLQPKTGPEILYAMLALLLILAISALVTLHAVGLPETYWDALILYIGYAREIFQQGAFPTKVVGQVGIGLGANYPHLYPLLSAQTAALAGQWSDIFAQALPPIASMVAMILLFYIAQELTRNTLVAISAALLFRSVPYGIAYSQYASDYAIAIAFTAAFAYCALLYVAYGLRSYLALTLLIAAFAVHINYLMWILWVTEGVMILILHLFPRKLSAPEEYGRGYQLYIPPDYVQIYGRPSLGLLLRTRFFWGALFAALALSAPWYIRNVVVTGNPVYAFFYKTFPSKHVNPEVMRSAQLEWLINGDGIWRAGRTFGERLANSWQYFVTGPQQWKLSPVLMAFAVPGLLLFILHTIWRLAAGRKKPRALYDDEEAPPPRGLDDAFEFGITCAFLFLALLFYEYFVAGYYLYHIIIILPLLGVFACFVFELCHTRAARGVLYALCILVGFSPGVIVGMMGFKLLTHGTIDRQTYSQVDLTALKNLFMDRKTFYKMAFNGDMDMFLNLMWIPSGGKLLTHENRQRLVSENIKLVHLDDWEVQQAYGKPPEERIKILDDLGIDFYLYVPNEDNHIVNARLGMDELIGLGYYKEFRRTPASRESNRQTPGQQYKNIPPNENVLYARVKPGSPVTEEPAVVPKPVHKKPGPPVKTGESAGPEFHELGKR